MKRQRPSPGDRLADALRGAVPPFAGEVDSCALASESWSSITFAGARHVLRVRLNGEGAGAAADALLAALAEPELDIAGHLLVDLAVTGDQRDEVGNRVSLTFSAVTVEAGAWRPDGR
jgi:hypothetical protein